MGYTITIGELEIRQEPDDGLDAECIHFMAKAAKRDDAPAFGDPTDFTNSRWPSYTTWAEMARAANLYDVFFYQGRLIGGHPGVRLVTLALAERVSEELESFKERNPEAKPQYETTDEDANLCRLIWLDYWLKWSLENCKVPVISNS